MAPLEKSDFIVMGVGGIIGIVLSVFGFDSLIGRIIGGILFYAIMIGAAFSVFALVVLLLKKL